MRGGQGKSFEAKNYIETKAELVRAKRTLKLETNKKVAHKKRTSS